MNSALWVSQKLPNIPCFKRMWKETFFYLECSSQQLPNFITWQVQFSSVQPLSRVRLFATPWTAAHQASLSITNSWSSLKLMFNEMVMPSIHLTFYRPLLLLPSIFPSIRVFYSESVLRIRWPKYRSFRISPSNEYSRLVKAEIHPISTVFQALYLHLPCIILSEA